MESRADSRSDRRARGELRRVLVVDDEADIRELLDLTLSRMGLAADCAASVGEARSLLASCRYHLCLTDMRLPDGEGLDVVRAVGELCPQTPVAVITAFGSTENAVAALKAGAFDYLAKPVALDQLRTLIKSALELPNSAEQVAGADRLIGTSPAIAVVREMIDKLARLIHAQSARNGGSFVPVNCGAIPESLMESEFFGYRKGAFTGADSDRDGFFQAASGGTLFLDEVADLPLAMQVKLLRAIQEKRVRKVGAATEEVVDVRIISATHRNLREEVDQGRFRQDLYYRLAVIELRMPALRERSEDIPVLVESLLLKIAGSTPPTLSEPALLALSTYAFPGNVRELENILERATALSSSSTIDVPDLQLAPETDAGVPSGRAGETLDDTLNRVERAAILDALSKTGGNRTAAARLLGVTFRSLRYRIERLGIDD